MKTIYYFTADWCKPCKKTKPIVAEIQRDSSDIKFQIIDVDDNSDLVGTYQVRSVPTFILFENGIEKNRIIGGKTKKELEDFINGK